MLSLFSSLTLKQVLGADAVGIMGLCVGPSILCLFLLPVPPYSLSQVLSVVVQGFQDFFRHNPNTIQVHSTFWLFCWRKSVFFCADYCNNLYSRKEFYNEFVWSRWCANISKCMVCLFLRSHSYLNKVR